MTFYINDLFKDVVKQSVFSTMAFNDIANLTPTRYLTCCLTGVRVVVHFEEREVQAE